MDISCFDAHEAADAKLQIKMFLSRPISCPQLYLLQLVAIKLTDISIRQAFNLGGVTDWFRNADRRP